MLHKQATIEEMQAALGATRLPPKEHFAQMIRDGIINAKGQVTKLVGGEAEPEPGTRRVLRQTVWRPTAIDRAFLSPPSFLLDQAGRSRAPK